MKLTGHTVLITGGGSGIGGGLAKAFHERGNKVIITGRRKKVLQEFTKGFPGMDYFPMDVSEEKEIQKLFKFISKKYPTLDVLINNAGVMRWHDFSKPESLGDNLLEEININVKGLIRMTEAFLPLLMKQTESTLINISSGLAYMPLAMSPIYCSTKAAVHSLTMSLRYQLRNTSVKVIELAPPGVKTDLGKTPGGPDFEYPMLPLDKFIALTMQALESGKTELPIGQSKMLKLGSRLLPSVFFNMLNPQKGRAV
jgi:uncharacterized oxidoreductase